MFGSVKSEENESKSVKYSEVMKNSKDNHNLKVSGSQSQAKNKAD